MTHIDRPYRINELYDKTYTVSNLPTNTWMMYSTTLYGMRAPGVPNDQRNVMSNYTNGYYMALTIPAQYKNGTILGYLGKEHVNDINLSEPASYVQQYFNITGKNILVAEIDANGQLTTKKGIYSDILTIGETNNIEDASLLIAYTTYGSVQQVIVINDKRVVSSSV